MSSLYMSNEQRLYGYSVDDDVGAAPVVPSSRPTANQEMKKDSVHKSSKQHQHSSHKHHSHHGNSGEKHHRHKSHNKSSTQKSENVKESVTSAMYSPEESRVSTNKHHQSVPKSKMQKLPDEKSSLRRSNKQERPGHYSVDSTPNPKSLKKKNVTQSESPIRGTLVPAVSPPSTRSNRREQPAPNAHENRMVPQGNQESSNEPTSYPGAYYETGSGPEESSEESESMYDVENGGEGSFTACEGLITAYVVPNEETYYSTTPENTSPCEVVRRSNPPPPSQIVKAPRQINETKQSLTITVPQGSSAQPSGPVPIMSVHSQGHNNCGFIWAAVICALVGAVLCWSLLYLSDSWNFHYYSRHCTSCPVLRLLLLHLCTLRPSLEHDGRYLVVNEERAWHDTTMTINKSCRAHLGYML